MANPLIDHFLLPRSGGHRPFVRMGDDILSEGDFVGLTARLAHVLAAHGIAAGDRVLVQLETQPLVLALFQACLRLGAVMVPTSPGFSARTVADLTGHMAPRIVVCRAEMVTAFVALMPGVPVLGAAGGEESLVTLAAGAPEHAAIADVAGEDTALILFTTGTSGTPKPAALSHGGMRANAQALVEAWGIGRDDVIFHALPLYHIHGLVVATNVALASGCGIVMLPKFDTAETMEQAREATIMMAPPAHYVSLLARSDFIVAALPRMRLFISGGAIISRATHAAFEGRTGRRIVERYGMTEGGMMTSAPPEGERRVGNLGRPLRGTDVRICDPLTGDALPEGCAGEIEVRGPGVFRGYARAGGLDRSDFQPDGFFRTRDLGCLNADGTLEYLGRASELMDLGCGPIAPAMIERRIERLDGVVEAVAVEDRSADRAPGLFLAIVADADAILDESTIADAIADLPEIRGVPLVIAFPAALPRTPSGKVQKRTLKADLALSTKAPAG